MRGWSCELGPENSPREARGGARRAEGPPRSAAGSRAARASAAKRGDPSGAFAPPPRRGAGEDFKIGVHHYITVSAILFVLGVLGIFINRKNIIVILMAIELILLSVNINLVAFSVYLGDLVGQVFAMFVLTVAAGEAAIGLAILVIYFRGRATIAVDDVNRMRG